jgi:mitogen-activated protein kinase organizer 1
MQTYAEGHMHPVHSVAANSSSTTLLSCSDKTLVCTDLVTAQVKQKWWGHVARIEYVTCLGGGDADDVFASASYDSTVRLWDSRSKSKDPLMILEDAKDAVTCVSSVAGEPQIVTSSVDGKVCPKLIGFGVDEEYLLILMLSLHRYELMISEQRNL